MSEREFEAMLGDNHARLARIARHYAGMQDWPDLLQEIGLQLWRSRDEFGQRSELATWVYRVALNTAIGWQRRRTNAPLGGSSIDLDLHAGSTGPGDELALLRDFLASLDPVNRAVLLLDLDGMAREQIAEVLGLTGAAVAVRMTRLRHTFEQRYVEGL